MLLLVIKWIFLIVKVSECVIDTCDENNITTQERVAKMCQGKTTVTEDEQNGSENVDSVFLSLMKPESNCSCNVTVKHATSFVNINIKRLNNFSKQTYCGMEIDVYQIRQNENETVLTNEMPTKCNSTITTYSLALVGNEYLRFTSRVVDGNVSTGYCIQIEREHKASPKGSSLDITCGNQALSTSTDTPIHAQTTFSDTLTNPQTTLGDTTTHPQASLSVTPTRTQTTINDFRTSEQATLLLSSATPMIDKSLINDKTASDGDSTLYIAVGSGGGFILFVSLLVVIVQCKRRKSNHSVKEENSANHIANSAAAEDDDDDGLKYNVMYVSSERHDDIDVNYSTVDGDIPRHSSGGDEGCYSTVDNNKNIQDSSLNTHQATDAKEDDGVEHINAPTESGCVYAVVDKSHKTNSSVTNIETAPTSAVYAVVDKNRVRDSNEGNK